MKNRSIFLSFLIICSLSYFGQSGALDLSFGNGGKVITSISSSFDMANSQAIQTDGRIVAVGKGYNGTSEDFALARYKTDGTLDNAFGIGGSVFVDFQQGMDEAFCVEIQTDGKIVVAGASFKSASYYDVTLARLLNDGTMDTTFGQGGKIIYDVNGGNEKAYAVLLQSNGNILVVGSHNFNSINHSMIVRFNSKGSLDSTFGNAGKVIVASNLVSESPRSAALQNDGKILLAGWGWNNGSARDFAVCRFLSTGTLDLTFGNGGFVFTDFANDSETGNSIVIQSDSKIVVAGWTIPNSKFALVRYHSDGSLDTLFGSAGKVTTSFSYPSSGSSVIIDNAGKIVVAGSASNGADQDFALARYNSDGSLDVSFGSGGTVTTDFGGSNETGKSVSLQSDGKIVLAGYRKISSNSTYDFALARYDNTLVGLSKNIKYKRLQVYPNPPINGVFHIKTESQLLASISVFDVLGKCVRKQNAQGSEEIEINLSGLVKGIYSVECSIDGEMSRSKLVLE